MSGYEQIPLDDLLDTCLHGQTPLERDHARAQLIRYPNPKRVRVLLSFLDAPQRLVRRRAVRLLGDIEPLIARPYIERVFKDSEHSARVVVALARMLSSQTKDSEPLLRLGLQSGDPRIRQACATRSAPIDALVDALSDSVAAVRNKAAAALNELEVRVTSADLAPMCAVLEAADEACQRLLFRCAPEHPILRSNMLLNASSLDYCDSIDVINAHTAVPAVEKAWALSRLSACEAHHAAATDERIRQAYARTSSAEPEVLKQLMNDPEPGPRWMAEQALKGAFDAERLSARAQPHARLSVPSAQAPYGIRAGDERVGHGRVSAGLALCHGRLDVNIGVAVRSAEAAGISHVFVVGDRPLMKTAMRGTDHVLSIHMVSDGPTLVRTARTLGFQLVAVQQTPDSQPYHTAVYPPRPLFLMGAEDMGLPNSLRQAADLAVEIPMFGEIDSLNVATAATTVMFHWRLHAASISVEEVPKCT